MDITPKDGSCPNCGLPLNTQENLEKIDDVEEGKNNSEQKGKSSSGHTKDKTNIFLVSLLIALLLIIVFLVLIKAASNDTPKRMKSEQKQEVKDDRIIRNRSDLRDYLTSNTFQCNIQGSGGGKAILSFSGFPSFAEVDYESHGTVLRNSMVRIRGISHDSDSDTWYMDLIDEDGVIEKLSVNSEGFVKGEVQGSTFHYNKR
jgi:hypothetical protein